MADSKSRSVSNLPAAIQPTVETPTVSAANVGTGRAYNNGAATVTYTEAVRGGRAVTYTATSTPGSFTATSTNPSPITVTGLASGTAYTFAVTGINASGETSSSATTNSITASTVPQAPTIGTVTRTDNTTVSVPFTAGATGGSTITSYTVTSSPSISLSTSGTTSPLTVTGSFALNQAYTFTMAAVNANGTSSTSSASNSVTPSSTAFDSIATLTGTGSGNTTLTFSQIPQTYKHLQIRVVTRSANFSSNNFFIRINGNTGPNYSFHSLTGNGSTATASGYSDGTGFTLYPDAESTNFTVMIIDIHDYREVKAKTIRGFIGKDTNGSGSVRLASGMYTGLGTITQIELLDGGDFSTAAKVYLYGIKG